MLKHLNRLLRRLAIAIEVILGLAFSLPRRLLFWRRKPVAIKIFNAIRHPSGTHIMGRALAEKKLRPPSEDDGRWVNFKRILSQFTTAEAPNAPIELQLGERTHRLHTDRDGYFQLELPPSQQTKFTARVPRSGWEKEFPFKGQHDPPPIIIISDIDDTLIETGATAIRTMIATTIFKNALTRDLVPGMAALLKKLSDNGKYPLFTVTSSPWNLEGFLKNVFKRMQLKVDGIFMTDWGLTVDQWVHPNHDDHKLAAIRKILNWFPQSQAVLLGDDTQVDPEVYARACEEFPERIQAIYIRPVSGARRRREVERLLEKVSSDSHVLCLCGTDPTEVPSMISEYLSEQVV